MQFLYPQFLFALLALTIPVIIHLFHFRKYKKAVFSDIRFLKILQEQTKSNRRLKDLLILLCRLLAFAGLVFAFAQPFVLSDNSSRNHANLAVSIFIDNSISMQAIGESGPLFEEAKLKTVALLEALPEGTQIHLLSHNKSFGNNWSLSVKEAISHIGALETVKINRTSEQIHAIQKSWFDKYPSADHQVYWISDFQKASHQNFLSVFNDTSYIYKFIPLSSAEVSNIAIDSAWIEAPFISVGEKVTLIVKIHNYANRVIADLPVNLSVNGTKKGMMVASIPAQSSTTLSFDFLPEKVFNSCKVELTDYPVSFDDVFYVQLTASDKHKVMCINGASANRYLDALLEQNEKVDYTKLNELTMDFDAIGSQSAIILNELKSYSSGLTQMLVQYVELGGSIFIIPPTDEKYIAGLNNFLKQFNNVQYAEKQQLALRVTEVDLRNPIFEGVFVKIPRNADMPFVSHYYPPQFSAIYNGTALLKLNNGDALIWQNNLGKGKVYTLFQPIDERWGNLSSHALFVPLIINFSRGVTVKQKLYYTTGANMFLNLNSNVKMTGDKTILLKSGKEEFVAPVSLINSTYRVSLDKDWMPEGFYNLLYTGTKSLIDVAAFNSSRDESDPSLFDKDELNELINQLSKGSKVYSQESELLKYELQREQNGTPYWRLFVIIAVLALFAEMAIIKFLK
jgi:hypothetical protein